MPASLFANVLLAIALFLPQRNTAKRIEKREPARAREHGSDSFPVAVKLLNTGETEEQAQRDSGRIVSEQRLLAGTLLWTQVLGWATVILALSTLLLWGTTKTALQDSRKAFEAEHRPWIAVVVRPGPGLMFTNDDGYYADIGIVLRNTGRTPALDVRADAMLFFDAGIGGYAPAKRQELLSDQTAELVRRSPRWQGSAIFPNAPYEISIRAGMHAGDRTAWEEWYLHHAGKHRPNAALMLIGVVSYNSTVGKPYRETGFIAEVHRTDEEGGRYPVHPNRCDVSISITPVSYGSGRTT